MPDDVRTCLWPQAMLTSQGIQWQSGEERVAEDGKERDNARVCVAAMVKGICVKDRAALLDGDLLDQSLENDASESTAFVSIQSLKTLDRAQSSVNHP